MDEIGIIAGQSITVGFVASTLAQWVKGKDWFPSNALFIRVFVALLCVCISAISSYLQGEIINVETLSAAFFSYTVAATAFDHLFKKS